MANLMKTVEKACRSKDLSIKELKTAEGAVALSQCMDLLYKKEEYAPSPYAPSPSTEEIFYVATLLMKWLVSVPVDVFRKDRIGIPAILERIRKTYDGSYQDPSYPVSLPNLSVREMIAQWAYDLAEKTQKEWQFPFEIEKVKALRENGYSFDWFYFNAFQFLDLPKRPWCEVLRFYPPKQFLSHADFVWAAADMGRKDVLLCMKEVGFLTDSEIAETMAKLKEKNRELFLSVWYGDRKDKSPEESMLEALLAAEEPKIKEVENIVKGSVDVFRGNYELLKRAIACAPGIIACADLCDDKTLYEIAFGTAEEFYNSGSGVSFLDYAAKESRDLWLNAFKRHYPSESEKREFLEKHPNCAFGGRFYGVCPKKIQNDSAFWSQLYLHANYVNSINIELPNALNKDQTFLRMCQPVKPVNGFSAYFVIDSQEALDFALAYAKVFFDDVPKELLSVTNIYRILERNDWGVNSLELSLLSDEEFVVGAAAYQIKAETFFPKIDKSLRKVERVWKAWTTAESISKIWYDIPIAAKKTRAFCEHLLAIGEGVGFDEIWFAEAWNKYPDLAEALENEYVRGVSAAKDMFDRPLGEQAKRKAAEEIPDEKLRANVLKKLFG